MSDVFYVRSKMKKEKKDKRIIYDPDNIDLIDEISVQYVVDWLMRKIGRADHLPKDIADRINPQTLEAELAPLLDFRKEGDALWWCRSSIVGPLCGHEGVALVRDGRPIVYMRLWNY